MAIVRAFVVVAILALPLFTSCSTLKSGTAVKAAFDLEEQESWMMRKIPGLKTLSELVPPPNENRIKWDKKLRRQNDLERSNRDSGL